MLKATIHPTDISVSVSTNGHVLVKQRLSHRAFLILREHVPRFLENPRQAAMQIIPPFAATAVTAYTAAEESISIAPTRDLSLGLPWWSAHIPLNFGWFDRTGSRGCVY